MQPPRYFLLAIFCLFISHLAYAENTYQPKSGDAELDAALIQLNEKRIKNKAGFITELAEEFQVPEYRVSVLFSQYKFTPADVLITLSISDSSGQPVANVARSYFDNKAQGWGHALYLMKISKHSATFKQIKADVKSF